ncbi:MAG: hypothetical protein AMJ70_00390 [Dehalococcoidia bacterium SG8_51_3]|nr:MAG: hypothetical protein AMJ70_00390 [Dehalococcoidia bacterium SG8_51_3]
MERILTIILAGGMGERLQPLTLVRSKPAVPFAGKFRLIDFTLSNCINSGIRQVFVLTQYRSLSLQRHIQDGWFISGAGLGEFIYCVSAQHKSGMNWYRGTADAIRQNLDLVKGRIDLVLILSGDHVYKMNYGQFLNYHMSHMGCLTISAIEVKKEQAAGNLGVLEIDGDNRVVGFQEKPEEPKTIPGVPGFSLASMGIYIFDANTLIEALNDKADDFGREVLPAMLAKGYDMFVYNYTERNQIEDYMSEIEGGQRKEVLVTKTRDSSYWRDVGTIDSYYEASMDLVAVDPELSIYGRMWPLRTYQRPLPPSKCVLGSNIRDSIISDGCIISGGNIQKSILAPGVIVEKDAVIEESIIFGDVIIEPGVRIKRTIIDEESIIKSNTFAGYDQQADKLRGCTVSAGGVVVVPRNTELRNV